jgi:hypothetical protein
VLSVHVRQAGSGGAYVLTMPVAVTNAAGVTERIMVNVPPVTDTVIVLPRKYPTRPIAVVFDPDTRMLARINR